MLLVYGYILSGELNREPPENYAEAHCYPGENGAPTRPAGESEPVAGQKESDSADRQNSSAVTEGHDRARPSAGNCVQASLAYRALRISFYSAIFTILGVAISAVGIVAAVVVQDEAEGGPAGGSVEKAAMRPRLRADVVVAPAPVSAGGISLFNSSRTAARIVEFAVVPFVNPVVQKVGRFQLRGRLERCDVAIVPGATERLSTPLMAGTPPFIMFFASVEGLYGRRDVWWVFNWDAVSSRYEQYCHSDGNTD
jgi:hypothetical protein